MGATEPTATGHVRTMRSDEAGFLADLYASTYAGYVGWAERSAEDVRWRLLDRPGVSPEDVLVLETASGVAAYAVLRDTGEVVEFVVPPGPAARTNAVTMLAALEQRAAALGIERLRLNIPGDRDDLAAGVESAGFAAGQSNLMYVRLADLSLLVAASKERIAGELADTPLTVELGVALPNTMTVSSTTFTVEDGELTLDASQPDVTITVDELAMAKVMVGVWRPSRAFLARQATVAPLAHWRLAARILGAMQIDRPWYFSGSDVV